MTTTVADGYIVVQTSPNSRTVQVMLASLKDGAFYSAFDGNFNGIIQNNHQLGVTRNGANLNSATALAVPETGYNGYSTIARTFCRTLLSGREFSPRSPNKKVLARPRPIVGGKRRGLYAGPFFH